MFVIELFTTSESWKQTRCPLTDEWIKMMWYTFTMDYSAVKKNVIMPFVAR